MLTVHFTIHTILHFRQFSCENFHSNYAYYNYFYFCAAYFKIPMKISLQLKITDQICLDAVILLDSVQQEFREWDNSFLIIHIKDKQLGYEYTITNLATRQAAAQCHNPLDSPDFPNCSLPLRLSQKEVSTAQHELLLASGKLHKCT